MIRGQVSRVPWYFIHWLFGTGAVLLAWYNIFKGLDLYVEGWTVGTQKVFTSNSMSIYSLQLQVDKQKIIYLKLLAISNKLIKHLEL
jgi:hypothetical protein